jgi:hypothetical protein
MKRLRDITHRIPRLPVPTRLPGRAELWRMIKATFGGDQAAAIAVTCTGMVLLLLGMLSLAPALADSQALRAQVAAARRGIATAQSDPLRSPPSLQIKIATAEAGRDLAARPYLRESQVSDLATALYECARLSGVEIIALSQPISRAGKPGEYEIRTLHLQVTAPLPKLIGFMALIRQAPASGFAVANLSLLDLGATHTLGMDILLYVSPFAPLTPAAPPSATSSTTAPSLTESETTVVPKPTAPSPTAPATQVAPSPTAPPPTAPATTVVPSPTAPPPTAPATQATPYPAA